MQRVIKFPSVSEKEIGANVFEELVRIYPEGKQTNLASYDRFDFTLPEDDPRAQALLECLARRGFRPWNKLRKQQPDEFFMQIVRAYDASDFEQAAYLEPRPRFFFGHDAYPDAQGVLEIRTDVLMGNRPPIGTAGGGLWLLVSDGLKRQMEDAGLRHLVFGEVRFLQRRRPPQECYWYLTSDLTLPPLAPVYQLVNKQGEPTSEYEEAYAVREGLSIPEALYRPIERHYRAGDLEKVEPFDVGLAGGFVKQVDIDPKFIVVSNRFYRFCVAHDLEMDWIPVRVDPD